MDQQAIQTAGSPRCLPDALAAVAACYGRGSRLPLALAVAHPAARVTAELKDARRVVYFQFRPRNTTSGSNASSCTGLGRRPGEAALALATSTTQLHTIAELLSPPPPAMGGQLSRIQLADVHDTTRRNDSSDSDGDKSNDDEADAKRLVVTRARPYLAGCGTHVGGLTTILVSRQDLRSKAAATTTTTTRRKTKKADPAAAAASVKQVMNHDVGSNRTLRAWLEERKRPGLSTHLLDGALPSNTNNYLFPSATVNSSTLSLPEEVVFRDGGSGTIGTGDGDDQQTIKTAVATMVASDFLSSPSSPQPSEKDVVFRYLLVASEAAVTDGMLGASQWWLQRPLRRCELPSTMTNNSSSSGTRKEQESGAAPALHVKFAADVFYVPSPLLARLWYGQLQCALLVQTVLMLSLGTIAVGGAVNQRKQQRGLLVPSGLASLYPSTDHVARRVFAVTAPSAYVTATVRKNGKIDRIRRRRRVPVMDRVASALSSTVFYALSLPIGLILALLLCAWEAVAGGSSSSSHSSSGAPDTSRTESTGTSVFASVARAGRLRAEACRRAAGGSPAAAWMRQLGKTYSGSTGSSTQSSATAIIEALDASHTSITGTHLLALANGTTAVNGGGAKKTRFIRALDVAGCGGLKSSSSSSSPHMHANSSSMDDDGAAGRDSADAVAPALCRESDTGLALGRLSYGGGLRWLNACGSSLNDAAVAALGTYCLLQEVVVCTTAATVAHQHSSMSEQEQQQCPPWHSSLLAMHLTSCRLLRNLGGLSYVPSLVQLLTPFTDVADGGLDALDGRGLAEKLAHLSSSSSSSGVSMSGMAQLLRSLADAATANSSASEPSKGADLGAVLDALAERMVSHLYHVDLTFMLSLCDVRSLIHAQRALQFLNISQTQVYSRGFGAEAPEQPLSSLLASASAAPRHKQQQQQQQRRVNAQTPRQLPSPLRVLVCDPCDHLSSLRGLTPALFPAIEKLYLRCGSLSEDGIASAFAGYTPPPPPPPQSSSSSNSGDGPFPCLQLIDLSYCDKLHDLAVMARFPALHTLCIDSTEMQPGGLSSLASPTGALKVLSVRYCPEIMDVMAGAGRTPAEKLARFKSRLCDIPSLEEVIIDEDWLYGTA